MKLLVDVNVSPRVVTLLRAAGHDAIRIGEVLDVRVADEAILAEAARTASVVLSCDEDFSALLAASGAVFPSLVNLRLTIVEPSVVASIVDRTVRHLAGDLLAGAIVTIDDGGVRVRRLPIA